MTVQKTRVLPVELVERISELKNEPEWMRSKRLQALDLFEELPMPNWWQTDFSGLRLEDLQSYRVDGPGESSSEEADAFFRTASAIDQLSGYISQRNAEAQVQYLDEQLKEQGVILMDLDTAVREHGDLVQKYFMTDCVRADENKFTALHAALWSGGVFLYVPKFVEVKLPFQAQFWLDRGMSGLFEHVLIIMEDGSRISFVETVASASDEQGNPFHNAVVEIYCGPGAEINYAPIQALHEGAINYTARRALLAKDASINWYTTELGSKLTRSDNQSILNEPGGRADMKAIFLGTGKQHLSIESNTTHAASNCWSDIVTKGALADQAVSVFNAVTDIRNDATGTKTYQRGNTLLLSDEARTNAIPGLYIKEHDIEGAGHAATMGKVDPEALFYLRSRGIPEAEALKIFVHGFLDEVLNSIPLESVRQDIINLIDRKLASA